MPFNHNYKVIVWAAGQTDRQVIVNPAVAGLSEAYWTQMPQEEQEYWIKRQAEQQAQQQ